MTLRIACREIQIPIDSLSFWSQDRALIAWIPQRVEQLLRVELSTDRAVPPTHAFVNRSLQNCTIVSVLAKYLVMELRMRYVKGVVLVLPATTRFRSDNL